MPWWQWCSNETLFSKGLRHTPKSNTLRQKVCSNETLFSKGLRLFTLAFHAPTLSSNETLISKG